MAENGHVTSEELIAHYDVIENTPAGIIAVAKAKANAKDVVPLSDYRVEIGSTGLRVFGGYVSQEFLTELVGLRGYRIYDEMRKNDPVIGGLLFAVEQAIRRVKWFVKPFDQTSKHLQASEFIEENMHDMSHSWNDFISEVLTFLPFGYSWFETVYKERRGVFNRSNEEILGLDEEQPMASNDFIEPKKSNSRYTDGRIGWEKFAYRPPDTLFKWEIDRSGEILGMWQQDIRRAVAPVFIPIEKSILFRTRRERNNPEGVSVLRNSYKPYYFKRELEKFEAIALERTGAGIPVIQLPLGYTRTDLAMASNFSS